VLIGRLVPLVRSFVSIPAGVLGMTLGTYTALTLIGA
jgi:membrane protein DedA with SNARE-associated domain